MTVSSYKSKQMIVMRRDLKMRKGKIAAQAGHACVEAVLMALVHEGRTDELRAGEGGWIYLDDPAERHTLGRLRRALSTCKELVSTPPQRPNFP